MKAAILVALTASLLAQQQVPLDSRPSGPDSRPSGMIASRDGKLLFVLSGGAQPSIRVLSTADWRQVSRISLRGAGFGVVLAPDGRTLYASGGAAYSVFALAVSDGGGLQLARELEISPGATHSAADFIGDVALSPDGRLLYAADLYHDSIAVINPQSQRVEGRIKTGRRPYQIVFHPDGKTLFVSNWADASVAQYDALNGSEVNRLRLGPQTMGLAIATRKIEDDETSARYRLFAAAANTNNIFVVGIGDTKNLRMLEVRNTGFTPRQPAGMMPSALALSADQTRLFVASTGANAIAVLDISESRSRVAGFLPAGRFPIATATLPDGRVLALNAGDGTLTAIPAPSDQTLPEQTRAVLASAAYRDAVLDANEKRPAIEHVIYVLEDGPNASAPNHVKLAREFERLDNFQIDHTEPAEALGWAIAGAPSIFTLRTGRGFDQPDAANVAPAGFLWTNARSAGLTVRNYGVLIDEQGKAADGPLASITNSAFRGADRARVFLEDLKRFEAGGTFPNLITVSLSGSDSDLVLGQMVEAVSKSRFWSSTAILVVGRPAVLVISPFTRGVSTRGVAADKNPYDPSSVLRTVEFLLGLKPMTMFDAAARPLTSAFSGPANNAPYSSVTSAATEGRGSSFASEREIRGLLRRSVDAP